MIEYVKSWMSLATDRRGVTALEYGLIAGVLAVGLVTVLPLLSTALNTSFTTITGAL